MLDFFARFLFSKVVPVFSLTIGVSEDQRITYTPDITVFEGHFSDFVRAINETLAGIPLLVHDRMFRPFTQPILYGKMENYRPSEQVLVEILLLSNCQSPTYFFLYPPRVYSWTVTMKSAPPY